MLGRLMRTSLSAAAAAAFVGGVLATGLCRYAVSDVVGAHCMLIGRPLVAGNIIEPLGRGRVAGVVLWSTSPGMYAMVPLTRGRRWAWQWMHVHA